MATRLTLPPLLTVAEIRAAEAASPLPGAELMERAGMLAARAIVAFAAPRSALVVCGTGGNGGDGYAVARHLAAAGIAVAVTVTGNPAQRDAATMRARWSGPVAGLDAARGAEVLVDAVTGIGCTRPLAPGLAARLAALAGRHVVALDVPSGLDSDTGEGACLAADLTVAFGACKPVHLLAADRCGRVVVAGLGLDTAAARLFATAAPPPLTPPQDSHKYARGTVLVLGGAPGFGGAARLAARAAVRGGAGLALLAVPASALAENAARLDAVMVRAASDGTAVAALLAAHRFAAAIAGPGLADDGERIGVLLASGIPLVLDAGIFTHFAGDVPGLAAALRGPAVLTPHTGEFVRLFGDLSGSRLDRVRTAAARIGTVVLLKGRATIIAAPDGRAAINAHATPWLATAGSGDVLSGVVAALLAQGFDAFDAACAGAWLHGEAGRCCGAGLTADDLPAAVGRAVAAL